MPTDYDDIYLHYAREGARVLCLGYKDIGILNHQQVRDLSREDAESGLQFAGFIVISCPLKPDTKHVIKEILNASHHITMITGDNPLTACHVGAQLKLIDKKNAYVLSKKEGREEVGDSENWFWKSIVDENKHMPLNLSNKMPLFANSYCLTGEVTI